MMKFLVFLAIVVSIWYAMRWVQRANAIRHGYRPPEPPPHPYAPDRSAGRSGRRPAPRATDTIVCSRCGTYVPADFPTACGRGNCPFPKAG